MPKRQFTGGAGGRKGYSGGFGTGGITWVDFLGVVPDQPSMLLLVGDKGDWCIRSDLNTVFIVINTPSSLIGNWQQLAYPVDPSKVLADAADPTPGYLDAKMDNETLTVDATRHVSLLRSVGIPVLALWDNSVALPPLPAPGDRYAALVTANGWIVGNIYQWNGAIWVLYKGAIDGTIIITYTGTVLNWYYYQTAWYILFAGFSNEIEQHAAKVTPTTSDLLLIEDAADFYRKKKITIAALPAATPASHALAGAQHSADSITNLNTKLNDGDVISTKAAEISALTERTIPVDDDIVLAEDSDLAAYTKKKIKVSKLRFPAYDFNADQLVSPNNADWYVNALAPASADTLNNALVVRRFDDTAEEGVGFLFRVPVGATGFTISLYGRAQTAPGAPQGVRPNLYFRRIRHNTAVSAWGTSAMAAISIPANTNFQLSSDSIAFSGLSALDNDIVQFELTRVPSDGSDTLVGDYALLNVRITFY